MSMSKVIAILSAMLCILCVVVTVVWLSELEARIARLEAIAEWQREVWALQMDFNRVVARAIVQERMTLREMVIATNWQRTE